MVARLKHPFRFKYNHVDAYPIAWFCKRSAYEIMCRYACLTLSYNCNRKDALERVGNASITRVPHRAADPSRKLKFELFRPHLFIVRHPSVESRWPVILPPPSLLAAVAAALPLPDINNISSKLLGPTRTAQLFPGQV